MSLIAKPFVISRQLAAPRELVFRAWTDPAHLPQWMGPTGMPTVKAALDLRPGGTYHYGLRMPDGNTMWGKWTFREIAVPERLVFVQQFSDEHGGLGRHPMNPDWPQRTLSTITFEAQGPQSTLLTIHWEPFEASELEIRTFNDNHASMNGGWRGTFEQLAGYLAKMRDDA